MRTRKKSQEGVRDYLVREFAGTKLDSREQKAKPSVEDNRRTRGHLDGWHETSNIKTFRLFTLSGHVSAYLRFIRKIMLECEHFR